MYSDWIDACDEVAKEAAVADAEDRRFSNYGTRPEASAAAATAGGDAEDDGYGDDY